jgi:hypothetical protein
MSNPIPPTGRTRGMAVKILVVAALVALLGAGGTARADNPTLIGDVGLNDSFSISLKDSTGAAVTHVPAGTYTLLVHDHSALHNFDLGGPGVAVATGVDTVGDQTFTVTLADGTYFFQCDEHVSQMHGSFTVGSVTAPPPPPAPTPIPLPVAKVLAGSIGPGAKFALAPSKGLSAGKFKIKISDRSATDGFRLAGGGLTRATGAKFRGSVTWAVTLKAGKYSYGSAGNAKLRRSFTISG